MSRFFQRPFIRLALIGALGASLGLAACGRKGPLDPPPGGSLGGAPQSNAPGLIGSNSSAEPIGAQATGNYPGVGPNGQPLAPPGPRKNIPLDVLLN